MTTGGYQVPWDDGMLVDDQGLPVSHVPYTDRDGITLAKADDFYNNPPLKEPPDFAH